MANCIVCGREYVKTRIDRLSCSSPCACKLSRTYKDKYADKMTKDEYLLWRKEQGPFWKPKNYYDTYRDDLAKLNPKLLEKRETVSKFFKECVAKKWQLDRFDILHLLMIFSDLFPNRHTSEKDMQDPEEFYSKCVMLIKRKLKL